jgi:hypothetical protein
MTPAQAAERAGVSRWTIMRAIKIGVSAGNERKLPARRDNRNRWQIEPDDLDRWAAHCAHSVRAQDDAQPAAPVGTPLEAEVEELSRLRVEAGMLRERAETAERDRDAWREDAGAWKRQAEALMGDLATRRRRWWSRR